MAKSGPKPKNPALKVLEGSRVRSAPATSADRMEKLPPAPARYDAESRAVWKSLGHKLLAAGVLAKTDFVCLEVLTDSYVDYLAAQTTTDRRRCEKASKWLLTALKECGLTPASRRGVATLAKTKAATDPATRYFEG